jgi:hypothetical protein
LDLNQRSSVNFCTTRTSPKGSSASSTSTDGLRVLFHRPRIGAWHARVKEFVSFFGVWWPRISIHPSPAPVFGCSRRPLAIPAGEMLSRGGAWSSHATTGGSQSLPSTGFVLLFLLLFIYLTWVIVFLFGKLLYLKLCWYLSFLQSYFQTLTMFLLFLPSFGGCCKSQERIQLSLS